MIEDEEEEAQEQRIAKEPAVNKLMTSLISN